MHSNAQLFASHSSICCAFKEQEQDKMFVRAMGGSTLKQSGQQCHHLSIVPSKSDPFSLPYHALSKPHHLKFSYLLLILFAAHLKSRSKIRCLLEKGEIQHWRKAGSSAIIYQLYLQNLTCSVSLTMPRPSHALWRLAICSSFYLLRV